MPEALLLPGVDRSWWYLSVCSLPLLLCLRPSVPVSPSPVARAGLHELPNSRGQHILLHLTSHRPASLQHGAHCSLYPPPPPLPSARPLLSGSSSCAAGGGSGRRTADLSQPPAAAATAAPDSTAPPAGRCHDSQGSDSQRYAAVSAGYLKYARRLHLKVIIICGGQS